MKKLFGTDGIRGVANTELTTELALNVGRATAFALMNNGDKQMKIVIGKDTRISSSMLESAISAGLCSMGANVVLLGVVPTPAVAYLAQKYKADAGIMISASHNPAKYNGIKIFGNDGFKISDSTEKLIEEIVLTNKDLGDPKLGDQVGTVEFSKTAIDDYCDNINNTCDLQLTNIKALIDCANGSASSTAVNIFKNLGLDCDIINDTPDGININNKCGSTYIETLSDKVIKGKYDIGIAFDGDADRILTVDNTGEIVDGDKILAILSKYYSDKGILNNDTVVGTVMSNLGLTKYCKDNNINLVQTGVGDRFVLEEMEKSGYVLGGEQSGHIIIRSYQTTGDGQLTGVQIMKIIQETGKSLNELASVMKKYPQVLENLTVTNDQKTWIMEDPEVISVINSWEQKLKDNGRILVRASGTEPLIRIMVEGSNYDDISVCARSILTTIKGRLETA